MSSASSRRPWRWAARRLRLPLLAGLAAALLLGAAAAEPARLGFAELYKGYGVLGLEFSDRLVALKGETVSMRGFMAPPLKAESKFFVLTREPMAICPFCQSDADWPTDIVVIYLGRQAAPTDPNDRIEVTGRLEVGSWLDPETGFLSQIRLVDARFRRL
jgi:hypothetical protein